MCVVGLQDNNEEETESEIETENSETTSQD